MNSWLRNVFNLVLIWMEWLSVMCCPVRWHVDWDDGLRAVLGISQHGDGRPDPLQRAGLCRCSQAGSEGEAGLNVCVWKAAWLWWPHRLILEPFISLHPASAGLEPLLRWAGVEEGAGHQCRPCALKQWKDRDFRSARACCCPHWMICSQVWFHTESLKFIQTRCHSWF